MTVPIVRLSEVTVDAQPGFASGKSEPDGVLQVRMNNVATDGSWDWSKQRRVPATPRQCSKYALRPGDILVNVTNSPNLVGKTACFQGSPETVLFSNHFVRLRLDEEQAEPEYVRRWMNLLWKRRTFEGLCTQWVNQASVRKEDLLALRIPLPPLPEQRRIAAILDKVDAIRRKRQQTLDLADQFLRSTFLDMFGDPVTNPKGWPVVRLANLIDGPVRNGLSPSKSGTHAGEVLTLAAITGDQFRAERRKTAFFDIKPPLEKMVDARDFLICRGNGNIDLVGRACFPAESMPGVLFPDTMIGFRINTDTVAKAYLHLAWETKAVRNQIVTKSRTTSGIHKVNQQTLKTISLPLPPFEEQTRFEQLASKIHTTKKNLTSTDTDALLGSLVQRAFRGDL